MKKARKRVPPGRGGGQMSTQVAVCKSGPIAPARATAADYDGAMRLAH